MTLRGSTGSANRLRCTAQIIYQRNVKIGLGQYLAPFFGVGTKQAHHHRSNPIRHLLGCQQEPPSRDVAPHDTAENVYQHLFYVFIR